MRPSLGALDFGAGEFVIALGIAAFDRDQQLIAGPSRVRRALEIREGENAFAFESDVEDYGIGGDGDYRPFELFAAVPRYCACGSGSFRTARRSR